VSDPDFREAEESRERNEELDFHLTGDEEEGYDLDDPKHPTYHDRMSEIWDNRDKTKES
jgi:hypothetical protein